MSPWSYSLLALCVALLVCSRGVNANFWGQSYYPGSRGYGGSGNNGGSGGCSWGSQAAAVPGQCNTFRCVSLWAGAAYVQRCPFGTVFSRRQGRCVSPLSVASQCGVGASPGARYSYWL